MTWPSLFPSPTPDLIIIINFILFKSVIYIEMGLNQTQCSGSLSTASAIYVDYKALDNNIIFIVVCHCFGGFSGILMQADTFIYFHSYWTWTCTFMFYFK